MTHENLIVIADIEGSSGCLDYESGSFMSEKWPRACREMSHDVNAVVTALFDAGAKQIMVKDFHRTGFNLFPRLIHPRAELVQGYLKGPVPGLGTPGRATGLIMLGMHAPSGSTGFLAHTLTSRISRLMVNNRLMSEAELFSALLAPFGIAPIFFSGCPVACRYAARALPGVSCFPINKTGSFEAGPWRLDLAYSATKAVENNPGKLHLPHGPFHCIATMKEGRTAARAIAGKWGFKRKGTDLHLSARSIQDLFDQLICLAYLTPHTKTILPLALPLYNLMGRAGRLWAQSRA